MGLKGQSGFNPGNMITAVIVVLMGLAFLAAATTISEDVQAFLYSHDTQAELSEGTFAGTEATDGVVLLQSANTSGTYTAAQDNSADQVDYANVTIVATNFNFTESSLNVTVQVSDDQFATIKDSQTVTNVTNGTTVVELTALDNAEDTRVFAEYSRSSTTINSPELDSYEVNGELSGTSSLLLSVLILIFGVGILLGFLRLIKIV